MPRCSWPDCTWVEPGKAERGWLCTKKGHDTAGAGDWIAAVRLPGAAASVLQNSATDTADLRALTEEDVKELGLKAVVDRRFRHHLRNLGNADVEETQRLSLVVAAGSPGEPGRAPVMTGPPAPFTEKWRTQVKLFAVPASAIVCNKMIGTGGLAQVWEGEVCGTPCAIKKFSAVTNLQHEHIHWC
jgi:hypothetical protein